MGISSILIGVLLLVAIVTIAVQPTRGALPLLLPALVVLLLFGWLTVMVDEGSVFLRFGIGLIRRRIPLTTIGLGRRAQPVVIRMGHPRLSRRHPLQRRGSVCRRARARRRPPPAHWQ